VLRPLAAQEEAIDHDALRPGVTVIALWAVLSLALVATTGTAGLQAQFPELPPGDFEEIQGPVLLFALFSAAAGPFVWAGGLSALMYLAARPFGGGGSFHAMLAGIGLACTPWVVAGTVQLLLAGAEAVFGGSSVLGTVSLAASIAALVWHVVLVVNGGSRASGIGYGGATGSCALSAFGCATAVLFLFITLVVLVVALSR
jgi:hypothetical protein